MNSKEVIAAYTKLFTQEESLKEEVKEITDEAKAAGLNPAVLKAVAKAIVANKVDELIEKSETTLEMVNLSRS